MDLQTYFNQLEPYPPRTSFIEKVMEKTGKSRAAIYRWMSGTTKPDKANMDILSDITGIAVDQLFPTQTKEED